ncbi:SRPBCC domain-containing protein [Nocardia sp. NPDC050712]|uniref:SRPBCC family protein n=1 Tax=Nocardia sp. NPDC050712 TaxID=3155518 RepID=UPI0033BFCA2E
MNPAAVEIGSFFTQPPPAVWRALSEPDLIELWLMSSIGFAAATGTHFIFILPTQPTGEIACEVLAARPAQQLTHTWFDLRGEPPARWVVDWAIQPEGRGTRLLLTQTGFDISDRRQKMARNAMERGWKTALLRLREALDEL